MKRNKSVMIICMAAAVCLAGAIAGIMISRKNPVVRGIAGLAQEMAALQEEFGEHFWTDAVNRIGAGNIQAEYSLNIGGMEALDNITVGLDGKLERDMEQRLFAAKNVLSVANMELAEPSLFGTARTLYLQVPSVWEGSLVMDADDIDGQWNGSALKKELAELTGRETDIDRHMDVNLFQEFYIDPGRPEDFFRENDEKLKALCKDMETVEVEKAQKRGLLKAGQAESLKNHILEDAAGNRIAATCYLVILPEEELKEIFGDVRGDIRLCVYLDSGKRIVRICTLPEEALDTKFWSGEGSLDLTGTEAVTDCVVLEGSGKTDFFAGAEIEGKIVIERHREEAFFYQVACHGTLTDRENVRGFSLESGLRGERTAGGEKITLTGFKLVLQWRDRTLCRVRGRLEFCPLAKEVEMPSGKERSIGDMGYLDGGLFLAECMKNIHENYSGYLKFLS